jgi:hypothetical protein
MFNNTLLKDEWVIEETRREILKFVEENENENTIEQDLWDMPKTVLRRKYIAMHAYIKKNQGSQINNPMMHLKLLEKEEQAKSQISRWKEILKFGQNLMKWRLKKQYKKINETKNWPFEKINKMEKS